MMNVLPATTQQTCAELGAQIQKPMARRLGLIVGAFIVTIALLIVYEAPNASGLAWILFGTLIPIVVWTRFRQPGLPLVCLMALQSLAVFALPIITQNPTLALYTEADVFNAGVEIFIFGACLALGWRLAFAGDRPVRPPRYYWALTLIRVENPASLCRAALLLTGASTLYQLALVVGWLGPLISLLPSGGYSVLRTIFDAAALGGTLVGGYAVGAGLMPRGQRNAFWIFFTLFCALKASSILLSGTMGVVAAVSIGYFLGARRPPWLMLGITFAVLSFFNLSKFEMRAKYWDEYGYSTGVPFADLPGYFTEWTRYSFNILSFNRTISEEDEATGQRLTDRLNNLQNLLYAQHSIRHNELPLLKGATYTLIPPLLIPRFLWPDKPRSHEGQILLNVHFGRQSLDATFVTYIAWGLLAEAYGNFGPYWGAIIAGLALGLAAGFVERKMRPYPITSLQAFFLLILAVHFSLSFEMVASVWITSVFQMFVALLLAVTPFAMRRALPPPAR
jgi:hypothetical protein